MLKLHIDSPRMMLPVSRRTAFCNEWPRCVSPTQLKRCTTKNTQKMRQLHRNKDGVTFWKFGISDFRRILRIPFCETTSFRNTTYSNHTGVMRYRSEAKPTCIVKKEPAQRGFLMFVFARKQKSQRIELRQPHA